MIKNIKETFLSKSEMCRKQVLQDPGCVGVVQACMHAMLQGPMSNPISVSMQSIQ